MSTKIIFYEDRINSKGKWRCQDCDEFAVRVFDTIVKQQIAPIVITDFK